MRKDYVAVSDAAAALDETPFVEQYWSALWQARDVPTDVAAVAGSEEYRAIDRHLARLPRGARILDAGCGRGQWVLYLQSRGFDAVGMDLSPSAIDVLTRSFPDHHFVCGDVRHTSFPSESFDAVVSWGVFEHFENGPGDCLREAQRLLRPGGWLFISVPFHNWRIMLRDGAIGREGRARAGADRLPYRFYQWRFTGPELQREVRLHGFELDTMRPIDKPTGAGRMLQWDLPTARRGTLVYRAAQRALVGILPASVLAHMIVAIARRT